MPLARFHNRTYAWFAACVMLIGALLPGISRAAQARGGLWIEVCSVYGTRLAPLAGYAVEAAADYAPDRQTGPDAKRGAPAHADHCPFCCPHAGAGALPPGAHGAAIAAALAAPIRAPEFHPARFQTAWTLAQPRAPPCAV
ncbi:MAG: DUF2946 family protein [Rhodocyclaceae bacterium]|nr:DUF2946 family protein [Rhodocyclaceae bacterium]MBX3668344.1 DUF2946 family protein [Rhodocyclaceae bacterium]